MCEQNTLTFQMHLSTTIYRLICFKIGIIRVTFNKAKLQQGVMRAVRIEITGKRMKHLQTDSLHRSEGTTERDLI
jgi:hypothetical protein